MSAFASEHHGIRDCGIGIGDQQLGYWGIGGWGSEDKEIGNVLFGGWEIGDQDIWRTGGLGYRKTRRIRYCEIGDRG